MTRLVNKTLRQILSIINYRSLSKKLLAYVILIGLVPLLFFGVLTIISTRNILKNDAVRHHMQLANQKRINIENIMGNIESLAANLSGIVDIHNALSQDDDISTYDKLTTQAKIGNILSGYTNLIGMISIDVFSKTGQHYHVGETLYAIDVNTELRDRLFVESKNTTNYLYWSGIEENINKRSNYQTAVVAAKTLNEDSINQQSDPLGLLVISYDPLVFSSISDQDQFAEYTIVFDSKNRIVYHVDQRYIGKKVSDSISVHFTEDSGHFVQMIDGKQMMVVYTKTQKGKWTVATFLPMDDILGQSTSVTYLLALLLLISTSLISLFGIMLSKEVVKPIRKITETFSQLKDGELEKANQLVIKTQDEIGELGHLFNSFIIAREDITEQKKLEKKLNEQNKELHDALEQLKETQTHMIQQEKLAGIGQLAAGVAHEINNPLGYVMGNVDMLKKYIVRYDEVLTVVGNDISIRNSDYSTDSDHAGIRDIWLCNKVDAIRDDTGGVLDDISEGLNRISEIVTGLKSFSRINQYDEKFLFNLNEGIRTTLIVANNELKYNCSVRLIVGEIPLICANGGQVNQVLLNMLVNAAHAIKEKHKSGNGSISIRTWADEKNVYCSIEDNGCGMTSEVQKRIFEPFFTTKSPGRGTGLGLGIAYDIICNKHEGRIDVASEPGVGTCFTITLPISNAQLNRRIQ